MQVNLWCKENCNSSLVQSRMERWNACAECFSEQLEDRHSLTSDNLSKMESRKSHTLLYSSQWEKQKIESKEFVTHSWASASRFQAWAHSLNAPERQRMKLTSRSSCSQLHLLSFSNIFTKWTAWISQMVRMWAPLKFIYGSLPKRKLFTTSWIRWRAEPQHILDSSGLQKIKRDWSRTT